MSDGKKNKASIAIIGSRGIPNNYGGFEEFTEILSEQLVERGYNIHVSCEHPGEKNGMENYNGVNLFYFPLKRPKSSILGMVYEVIYDIYSLFVASMRADQVYMLGYSAALFFFIPKLFGRTLYLNPDGFEWKRAKFNSMVKKLLMINEKMGAFWADRIVADSQGIKDYYDEKYDIKSSFIAYGASVVPQVQWDNEKLPEVLKNGVNINPSYLLLVARLEPENNIHTIINGYIESNTKKPLIIVGNFDSPQYEEYIKGIVSEKAGDKKIFFTGGIYDQDSLNMLRQNCFAYLHGHSVGGTNPSLVEAMAMESLLIAHDNQFNREVCEDSALYFGSSDELKNNIDKVENNPENYLELKSMAFKRVNKEYTWDKIVGQYHELFKANIGGGKVEGATRNIYGNKTSRRN
jgi:glycosyltransferase involved in cell wall biosynthesis